MAAANSTPIQLYYSNTPGSQPVNTSLIIGELAINVPDGLVFYKNSSNVVDVIARTSAAAGRFPNVTFTSDGTTQHTAAMPWGISNSVWTQANTSTQNISIIQAVDLSQNSSIIAVGSYANSAYDKANTVGSYTNSAFAKANTGFNDAAGASNYANAAFLKANTNSTNIDILRAVDNTQNTNIDYATTLAQHAYDYANTLSGGTASDGVARAVAQGAFDKANSAYIIATNDANDIAVLQGVDAAQNSSIVAAGAYANAAFNVANNITSIGQGAFDKANTATNNADGASNYANSAFAKANTATNNIAIIQAVNLSQNSDIIAASSYANSAYTSANNANQIAQGAFDKANNAYTAGGVIAGAYANAAFAQANTNATDIAVIQGVNLSQNSSIVAASGIATASFVAANSSGVYANASFGQANAAFTAANSAGGYANSAYTKANAAVANTSTITLAGNLNVPGQANVNQRLSVGTGAYQVLPNLIAQFTGFSNYYSQINQQNLSANGTGDVVITADNGTDSANYMDMGMAGSAYDNTTPNAFGFVNPNDAYLMMVGDAGSPIGGNLYIGTSGSANNADISFRQGTNNDESARLINGKGLVIKTGTAATDTTSGALVVTGGAGVSGSLYAGAVYDGTTRLKTYVDTANSYLQGAKVSKSGDTINGLLSINNGTSTALGITGSVTISKDLTISGNLIIGGNTTSVAANNLVVDDSILYIANNNNGNSSDIGIVGHFISDHYQHTGIVRDHLDGKWKLFSNVTPEPTTTVDFTTAVYDTLKLGTVESDSAVVNGLDVVPYLQSAYGAANAAFNKANTGGVRTVTVANSNRLTQNTGSGDVRLDLATTTVVAGTYTYPYLNVDAYGRITSISNQTPVTTITYAGSTYNGDVTISTTDIVNILGYTPVNNTDYFVDQGQLAGVNNRQNTNTVVVGSYANAAFGKANASMIQANNAWTTANSISDAALSAGVYANAALELATTVSYYANAPLELVTAAGAYANAAFGKANSSFAAGNVHSSYANAAFTKANTAFNNADAASSYANSAFTVANNTYEGIVAAGAYANAAFTAANNALIAGGQVSGAYANAAFGTANAAFIRANTAFNNADGASNYANAAFVLANTTTSGMVAAGSYANSAFSLANSTTSGMVAAGAYANAAYVKANTAFNNADGASNYANAAFVVANSAFTGMINAGGYANTAFEKANTAYSSAVIGIADATGASNYANAAFLKANTAVNNASGASNYANAAFALANTVSYYANTSRSSLINGSYTLSLDSQGVLNVPISLYNTAQVFAPINYDLLVGTSSKYWQFKGDGSALVFPDNTRQTTAYPVTAYNTANVASAYANAAFTKANTALANTSGATFGGDLHISGNVDVISVTFPDGTTQRTSPEATSSYANSAYNKANSAGTYANTAVEYATSAGGYANAAFIKANTAWSYLQNGANTVTLDSIGQLVLPQVSQGGITSGFLTSAGKFTFNAYGNLWVLDEYGNFISPYSVKITPGGIQWADGSTQNTAAASLAYTQQAFGGANAASSYANSAFGVANTGLSTATSAGSYANSAYVKANTAWTLANDAYAFANTLATGIAQDSGARNLAQGAYDKANSAFDVGQGAYDKANTNTTNITGLYGIENYQNTYIQVVESNALAASAYANAAFAAANVATGGVAGSYANAAFSVANNAVNIAQGAFDKANTDQYGVIAAGSYANAAFGVANTGVDIAQRAWNQANTSASFLYTVSSTPPGSPGPSDLWYDSTTDILYQYITTDGSHYYWIDIDSPTVSSANTTISYTYTGYGRAAAHAMIFGGF